jgi:hypothetical protein
MIMRKRNVWNISIKPREIVFILSLGALLYMLFYVQPDFMPTDIFFIFLLTTVISFIFSYFVSGKKLYFLTLFIGIQLIMNYVVGLEIINTILLSSIIIIIYKLKT